MEHDHKNTAYTTKGLLRLWKAFLYTCDGLKAAYRNEAAFRQELALAAVLLPLAVLLRIDMLSRALMLSSLLLVFIVELLNSAHEATVDLASKENHPLAKRAKDMGSAAVFLSLINLALVWLLCLVKNFF
jgi:diacylglycerol kinase (ATP)